jgi:SAM-dependent methyltransferase
MTASIWETPWTVPGLDGCSFYHTMDLPGVGQVNGQWDLRETIGAYLGPCPLEGRSVLDLGCASGFLSFAAERRGAEVVSFDLRDATHDLTLVPYAYQQHERAARLAGADEYFHRWKRGYWLAHRLLRSRARVYYGSVYDLPEELGQFDVVLLGQILVHLQNPVAALASAARRGREHLVIVEDVKSGEAPVAQFLPPLLDNQSQAWWHWSLGMFRHYLRILGFAVEDVARSRHLCLAYGEPKYLELSTITARRCPRWQEPPSDEEVRAFAAVAEAAAAPPAPPDPAPVPRPRSGLARRIARRVWKTLSGPDRQLHN